MRTLSHLVVGAGVALALSACGTNTTERSATAGATGAVAGAVVGGPVGAVIGGVGGAAAGSTLNEGVDKKVEDWVSEDKGTSTGGRRTAMSHQRVRTVQQALNDHGSNIAVDGIWGPNTRQALMNFQRSNGIEATGRVDGRTMSALDIDHTSNTGAGSSSRNTRNGMGRSGSSASPGNGGQNNGTTSGGTTSGTPGNTGTSGSGGTGGTAGNGGNGGNGNQ